MGQPPRKNVGSLVESRLSGVSCPLSNPLFLVQTPLSFRDAPMYNHQMARYQIDDVYWFLSLKWATPTGFDRMVEFGAYGTLYIGRHSGPIANPDDVYLKDIIFGVAPYDVVGVSTLEWWPTNPEQWQSIWAFVPTIRRVRRLTASNTSEGLFGSIIARDDPRGWSGKIQ